MKISKEDQDRFLDIRKVVKARKPWNGEYAVLPISEVEWLISKLEEEWFKRA